MSEAELKALNIKRGTVKGKLTHFSKFCENFSATAHNINQLKTRLKLFESSWSEFNEIQTQIEALHDDQELQLDERLKFESDYCTLVGDAQNIIDSHYASPTQPLANSNSIPSPVTVNNNQKVKLPVLSLPKFNGNYDEWLSFRDRFKSCINNDESLSDIDKFQYLQSCLSGESYDTIKYLTLSEDNYSVAWKKLEDRYEDKRLLVQSHISALFNLSNMNKNSATSIKKMIDTVTTNLQCLESLNIDVKSWDLMIIHLVKQKLDEDTLQKWESLDFTDLPNLADLTKFLTKLYKTLDASELNKIVKNTKSSNHFPQNSFNKNKNLNQNSNYFNHNQNKRVACSATMSKPICSICKSNHMLYQCPKFLEMSSEARLNKVTQLKLCKNCFRSNHLTAHCQSVYSCRQCHKKHHTLLHLEIPSQSNNFITENTGETITHTSDQTNVATPALTTSIINDNLKHDYQVSSQVLLSTVVVNVFDRNNKGHSCRAILDVGSQINFITEELFKKLNLNYTLSNSVVTGITQSSVNVVKSTNIKIKSRINSYSTQIKCLILPKITGNLPTFSFTTKHLKIPNNLVLADPTFNTSGQVDLLIGAELFWELLCVGQIQLGKNLPYLQKTHFGWIIGGNMNYLLNQNSNTCLLSLDQQLTKFWEIEEPQTEGKPLSHLELECENHFINNYYREPSGKFVVRLPFKENSQPLGYSKNLALKRFLSMEKRLIQNHDLYNEYKKFIQEYLNLGHMELVSEVEAEILGNNTSAYFLPHHAVVKTSSTTTKTRIVFDGSAKTTTGVSLNDKLLIGPTLQQELFSILIRFRTYKYALTADIEKMYRQIGVNSKDCNYQLILWRENPTLNNNIQTYRLTTNTYGTASAPFLAIRCLNQLADDESEEFPEYYQIIKRDFYVDDLLTGANSVEEAIKLRNNIYSILNRGNFHLRKWASNNPDLLPGTEKYNSALININKEGETKTLGLFWNCQVDILKYSVTLPETKGRVTKRKILSIIAQIFDPLGLIGPVLITAKIILQKLWSLKLDWDESVPLTIHTEWTQYVHELSSINKIQIPRNTLIEESSHLELHGFCDASQTSYGICIYLKSLNRLQVVNIKLLCAKSRVAPLKVISVPRLELCGAVLLVQFMKKVCNSLSNLKINNTFYWTDSTIVLSWISDSPSRWKTFVANRVTEIQNTSDSNQWRHVDTSSNPADIISRGVTPDKLLESELWWNGPNFLYKTDQDYPKLPNIHLDEITTDARIPQSLVSILKSDLIERETSEESNRDFETLKKYSSFSRLKRIVAYCLRWYKIYKGNKTFKNETANITYPIKYLLKLELDDAHDCIVRMVQKQHFPKEILYLSQQKQVPNNSKTLCLKPFLDKKGIIRVGGRLRNSNLNYDSKHQILLPKEHFVSELIILESHIHNLHAGPSLTLTTVRNKYWILSGRSLVRKVLHSCINCFRANPISNQHLMGDLPSARVLPARPFIHCGIDYAGPILIKGFGRSKLKIKSYIAVFICLSTKAIHIELVCGLSSEAFLSAFKRFIARRGLVSDMYSDNGTTFVRTNKELKVLKELFMSESFNKDVIQSLMAKNINWHFIPPNAPNFGGLWEAGVKSIKYHLKRIVGNAFLTYDELYTLLTQIEACLNSRPITPLSNDPNDLEPLTPAHFLIGDSLLAPVEPNLIPLNENRLSRWQRIQQLTQHFWKRWSAEYLTELQTRGKWSQPKNNDLIKPGNVVVLKEDNLPALYWRLGRISAVYPGADGLVRVVSVQTKTGEVKRPISKICVLPMKDNDANI